MTYEQYWERDPYLILAFKEAHELYIEQKNQELYLQGLYNYEAFSTVINAFAWNLGGRKGARPEPFRDYPIAITDREKQAEKERSVAKTMAFVTQGQKEP